MEIDNNEVSQVNIDDPGATAGELIPVSQVENGTNTTELITLRQTTAVEILGATHEIHVPDEYGVSDKGISSYDSNCDCEVFCSLIWAYTLIHFRLEGAYSMVIKVVNTINNTLSEIAIPIEDLYQSPISKNLVNKLVNNGFRIIPKYKKYLGSYLSQQHTINHIEGTRCLGWYKVASSGETVFVLPNQVIGQANDNVQFLPERPTQSQESVYASGTMEEWNLEIASKARGNPLIIFALGASLSSPLFFLVNLDGGGYHFYGHSSRGKTTLLQIAASVWGNSIDPAVGSSDCYIGRWSVTANGFETIGPAYSDISLICDELGTNTDPNFSETVYNLTAGQGKVRYTEDKKKTWRTNVLSSGELKVSDQIKKSSGKDALTGQEVRIIDIYIDNIFPNTNGQPTEQFVAEIKESCAKSFGTAGPVYLEHIVEIANDPERLRELQENFKAITTSLQTEGMRPEQERVAKRFAIVQLALHIAIELQLLNITEDEANSAVSQVFDSWLEDSVMLSDIDKGISNIRTFIRSNPRRFRDYDNALNETNNTIGYKNNRAGLYIIPTTNLEYVCGRSNVREIAKKMYELGLLHVNNTSNGKPRLTSTHRIAGAGRVTGYAISFRILNDDSDDSEGISQPKDGMHPDTSVIGLTAHQEATRQLKLDAPAA